MAARRAYPAGYLELDPKNRILAVGDECTRYLGYTQDELRGRPLAELLPLAGRVFFQTYVFPLLGVNGNVDEIYVSLRTKEGGSVPVLVNAARHATDDGVVDVLVFLPMRRSQIFQRELATARQDAERYAAGERAALTRVDVMQAQLAVSERLASVGTLAAGVAHEINNPLAYVSANVELLGEVLAGKASLPGVEVTTLVSEVQQGVDRIRDIVASLRKLSRIDGTRREPVDLGRVIEIALKITGTEVRQRAQVEVEISTPTPVVLADEGRLCQVAINLLVNASQAMDPRALARNRIRLVARPDGVDTAALEVIDNGPGIPKELQERVFDPFFTTKPVGEGTGLGLSVCHGIVTALGGTMTLESAPDQGARFAVRLPSLAGAAATEVELVREEKPAPPPPRVDRSRRVMVVDDDHAITRVFSRVLKDCEVVTCENGKVALDRLLADGFGAYDGIVCDLMMPHMTGMELYAHVMERSSVAAARMVFMTGGTFTDAARLFLESVPNPSLAKPFSIAQLRTACEAFFARADAADASAG